MVLQVDIYTVIDEQNEREIDMIRTTERVGTWFPKRMGGS